MRRFAAGPCEVTERDGRFLGLGKLAEAGYGGEVAGERYIGDAMLRELDEAYDEDVSTRRAKPRRAEWSSDSAPQNPPQPFLTMSNRFFVSLGPSHLTVSSQFTFI